MRRRICFLIVVVLIMGFGMTGCKKEDDNVFQEISEVDLDEGVTGESEEIEETEKNAVIFVHVCGEVQKPGVYEFPEGSRVYEAIEAAGGFEKTAAEEVLNQAEVLQDGQQLYVPSEKELEEADSGVNTGVSDDGKVNINKASKEELMTLSGIGEAKADAIIRYREQQSGFKSIEEIMEIEGIKEGVFQKIEDKITI